MQLVKKIYLIKPNGLEVLISPSSWACLMIIFIIISLTMLFLNLSFLLQHINYSGSFRSIIYFYLICVILYISIFVKYTSHQIEYFSYGFLSFEILFQKYKNSEKLEKLINKWKNYLSLYIAVVYNHNKFMNVFKLFYCTFAICH